MSGSDMAPASAGDPPRTMVLTYRYRLLPRTSQHRRLETICEEQRLLYNAALEERIGAFRKAGKSITLFDQTKSLAEWRGFDEEAAALPSNLQRWTIAKVNDAFTGFFSRIRRKNGKAGFPRFRSMSRWRSFGFREFSGLTLDGPHLRFKGMPGRLRLHLHRQLPKAAKILSATFTRCGGQWHVAMQVRVPAGGRRALRHAIGIDPGLTHLATLSDGTRIRNSRPGRRGRKRLRVAQRRLSRCQKGSMRRRKVKARLAREHRRIANARDTHLHQVTARLADEFDFIAVEKTNLKGLCRSGLAASFHDAAWGMFIQKLRYKAERAGALLFDIDARQTSQQCSGCGRLVSKELSVRRHDCPHCGLSMDRDENAARNILARAVVGPGLANAVLKNKRRAGNIGLKAAA